MTKLSDFLKLPEAASISDLDNVDASLIHKNIILNKKSLRELYEQFYQEIQSKIAALGTQRKVVELGSGGGFLKNHISDLITTDIKPLPDVDLVFSAEEMPFDKSSVDAFVGINVLHHFRSPKLFFSEAVRCLRPLGKIVFIEPANSPWGRFVYQHFHHERFDPDSSWENVGSGPMTSANGAIPWIIFYRDRRVFADQFPSLKIIDIRFHSPFRYLLSGGLSYRDIFPLTFHHMVTGFENALAPLNSLLGMFMTIELIKDPRQ